MLDRQENENYFVQSTGSRNRHYVILALIAIAALSAASYPFLSKICAQCSNASEHLIPGADKVGLLFYLAVLASVVRFNINKYVQAGIFLAAGVHVVLIAKLVTLHLLCVPCIVCAVAVALASLIAMNRESRFVVACASVGALAVVSSTFVYNKIKVGEENKRIKAAIHFNDLDLSAAKSIPIYIYKDSDCHSCKEFMDLYVPRLVSKYGEKIAIHVEDAPSLIPTPTIVVGGDNPQLIVHRPEWFVLTDVIDQRSSLTKPKVAETRANGF